MNSDTLEEIMESKYSIEERAADMMEELAHQERLLDTVMEDAFNSGVDQAACENSGPTLMQYSVKKELLKAKWGLQQALESLNRVTKIDSSTGPPFRWEDGPEFRYQIGDQVKVRGVTYWVNNCVHSQAEDGTKHCCYWMSAHPEGPPVQVLSEKFIAAELEKQDDSDPETRKLIEELERAREIARLTRLQYEASRNELSPKQLKRHDQMNRVLDALPIWVELLVFSLMSLLTTVGLYCFGAWLLMHAVGLAEIPISFFEALGFLFLLRAATVLWGAVSAYLWPVEET